MWNNVYINEDSAFAWLFPELVADRDERSEQLESSVPAGTWSSVEGLEAIFGDNLDVIVDMLLAALGDETPEETPIETTPVDPPEDEVFNRDGPTDPVDDHFAWDDDMIDRLTAALTDGDGGGRQISFDEWISDLTGWDLPRQGDGPANTGEEALDGRQTDLDLSGLVNDDGTMVRDSFEFG